MLAAGCCGLAFFSGCALQNDIATLDSHMVSMSQRSEKLEKRLAELEQQNSKLQQQNDQLNQRLNARLARQGQAFDDENKQIQALLKNLQKSQDQGDARLREQIAGLRVLNNRTREDLQNLIGMLELSEHKLKQISGAFQDIDKKGEARLVSLEELIEANNQRILKLEAYLNFESKEQGGPAKAVPAGDQAPLSEDELYAGAKQAFDRRDFEKAREGFEALLKQYPQSKNADNAQFWIGEIYYIEKWYEKSILEYQKVIENYPQGNKVPASLLKQGLAFSNIGDKANARLILKELISKYPKSNEAAIAEKKIKGL
jgi:tol-pal system protein YbgF